MKCISVAQIFVVLGFLGGTVANAQNSLEVVMVPGSRTKGCCSALYYLALNQALTDWVTETTIQQLQAKNVSTTNLVINNFYLVNTNQCIFRERSLLRGSSDANVERESTTGVERHARSTTTAKVNQYSSTCSACTKPSCSASCSGCYLCSSDRRDLQLLSGLLGLVGGVVSGVLGVTTDILTGVVGILSTNVQPVVSGWLNGTGAAVANGCMGDPSLIQVTLSLV